MGWFGFSDGIYCLLVSSCQPEPFGISIYIICGHILNCTRDMNLPIKLLPMLFILFESFDKNRWNPRTNADTCIGLSTIDACTPSRVCIALVPAIILKSSVRQMFCQIELLTDASVYNNNQYFGIHIRCVDINNDIKSQNPFEQQQKQRRQQQQYQLLPYRLLSIFIFIAVFSGSAIGISNDFSVDTTVCSQYVWRKRMTTKASEGIKTDVYSWACVLSQKLWWQIRSIKPTWKI